LSTRKEVVERQAARDDNERHGDAEPFIRQCEVDQKENNNNFTNRRRKSIYSDLRS
jgi:hypothetical protein